MAKRLFDTGREGATGAMRKALCGFQQLVVQSDRRPHASKLGTGRQYVNIVHCGVLISPNRLSGQTLSCLTPISLIWFSIL